MADRAHIRRQDDSFAKFSDRRQRDCRSPEALDRRSRRRDYDPDLNSWVKPPPPIVAVAPADDDLLHDAERLLSTGERVREDQFIAELRGRLRLSFDAARALAHALVCQGRLEQNVADNGFVTLRRPSGKAAHRGRKD